MPVRHRTRLVSDQLPAASGLRQFCDFSSRPAKRHATPHAWWRLTRLAWVATVLVPASVLAQTTPVSPAGGAAMNDASSVSGASNAAGAPVSQLRIVTVEGQAVTNETPAWETVIDADELNDEF